MNGTESLVTNVNNDVSALLAEHTFVDLDDVTQLLTQVNSKWENLRGCITTTEFKFDTLADSYPAFTGEL